ncbi:MAG: hypothetical protein HY319_17055 [Armatimonadetes bacterium]|nr:hypothetical protein [Armatimonadota bacterium]
MALFPIGAPGAARTGLDGMNGIGGGSQKIDKTLMKQLGIRPPGMDGQDRVCISQEARNPGVQATAGLAGSLLDWLSGSDEAQSGLQDMNGIGGGSQKIDKSLMKSLGIRPPGQS